MVMFTTVTGAVQLGKRRDCMGRRFARAMQVTTWRFGCGGTYRVTRVCMVNASQSKPSPSWCNPKPHTDLSSASPEQSPPSVTSWRKPPKDRAARSCT